MPETKDQPPHQHSYLKQALLTAAVTTATFTGLYFLVEQRIQHIVDQKLAGIVHSSSEQTRSTNEQVRSTNPPTGPASNNSYKGNDPYREPIE